MKLCKSLTLAFFVLLLHLFLHQDLSPQNTSAKREVGLSFSSIDFDGGTGFSAFYKKQLRENVYRRIRFFSGRLSAGAADEEFTFDFSAGIAIGREKRRSLDPKLEFYQGPEFFIQVGLSSPSEDDVRMNFTPGFGWVLGLQHSFNERWAVNLETIPSVSVSANINGDAGPDSVFFNAGFNNLVSLGLIRKF